MPKTAAKSATKKADPPAATPSTAVAKSDAVAAPAVKKAVSLVIEDASQLPDYMRDDVNLGTENISSEDMDVPRLKLMQALSKELEVYDGLKAGQFFHTATEQIIEPPFLVVPIYTDRRYLLWRPRDDGGGILARADDGVHWSPANASFTVKLDKKDGGNTVTWKTARTVRESGLHEWGTMNSEDSQSPPAATLMYNYVVGFPEFPDLIPAVLTFQRTSVKMGKRWNTRLKTMRRPLFGTVFRIESFDDRNPSAQTFKNIRVMAAGLLGDESLYGEYKRIYEGFAAGGLKLRDEESLQEEAGPNDTDDDAPQTADGGKRPKY